MERKFTNAIVRKPCRNIINGISNANLGKPDYEKAIIQHQKYIEALEKCGLKVEILVITSYSIHYTKLYEIQLK